MNLKLGGQDWMESNFIINASSDFGVHWNKIWSRSIRLRSSYKVQRVEITKLEV